MMRSAREWTAVGIVTAALLGGCPIGPNYKRPPMAEPPTFRGQAMAEAASLADAPWWEVFQDPILKTLIQEALRNNYDVRIAAARVQEARANFRVSRSDLYPSLDYSAGVARAKISPGIAGAPGGPANRFSWSSGTCTGPSHQRILSCAGVLQDGVRGSNRELAYPAQSFVQGTRHLGLNGFVCYVANEWLKGQDGERPHMDGFGG